VSLASRVGLSQPRRIRFKRQDIQRMIPHRILGVPLLKIVKVWLLARSRGRCKGLCTIAMSPLGNNIRFGVRVAKQRPSGLSRVQR
jgi:hypothetical protein